MDPLGNKSLGESSRAPAKAKSEEEKARAAIQLLSTFPLKSLFNLASYPNPHQELARIAISEASGPSISLADNEPLNQPLSSTRSLLARAPGSPTPSPRFHRETSFSSEDEPNIRDSRGQHDQFSHEFMPNVGLSWADDQEDFIGSDKGKAIASEHLFLAIKKKLSPGTSSSLRPEAKPFMTLKGTKTFDDLFPSGNTGHFAPGPVPKDSEPDLLERDDCHSNSSDVSENKNESVPSISQEFDTSPAGLPPMQHPQYQHRVSSMPEMTSARTWAEKARMGHLSSLSQARPMVAFKKHGKGHIQDHAMPSSSSRTLDYSSIETFGSSYHTTDSYDYNSSSEAGEADEMATTSGLEQHKKPTLFPGTMSDIAQNEAAEDFDAASVEDSSSAAPTTIQPSAIQLMPFPSPVIISTEHSNDAVISNIFAENSPFVPASSSSSSSSCSDMADIDVIPLVASNSQLGVSQSLSNSHYLQQSFLDSQHQLGNSPPTQSQQMLPYNSQQGGHGSGSGQDQGPLRGYLNMPPGIHHPGHTTVNPPAMAHGQSGAQSSLPLGGYPQMPLSAQAQQQLSQHQFSHQNMMHQHQQHTSHLQHMAQLYHQHHSLQQFQHHHQMLSQKHPSALQSSNGHNLNFQPGGSRMYFPHDMTACDGPFCHFCGYEEDDPDSAQNSHTINPDAQDSQGPSLRQSFFHSGSHFSNTVGGAAKSGSSSMSVFGSLNNPHTSGVTASSLQSQRVSSLASSSSRSMRKVSDGLESLGCPASFGSLGEAEDGAAMGSWYYPIPSAAWPCGIGLHATEGQKRELAKRAYPLDMTYAEIAVIEKCREEAKNDWEIHKALNLQDDLFVIRQKIQKLSIADGSSESAVGPSLSLAEAPLPSGLEESLEDSWNAYEKLRLADVGLRPKKLSETKQPVVLDPHDFSKLHPLVALHPELRPMPTVGDPVDNPYSILTDVNRISSKNDGSWGPMPMPGSRSFMPARKSESSLHVVEVPSSKPPHPFGAVGQEFDKLKKDCKNPNGLLAVLAQKQYRDVTAKVREQKKELEEKGYERLGSSALLEGSVSDTQ